MKSPCTTDKSSWRVFGVRAVLLMGVVAFGVPGASAQVMEIAPEIGPEIGPIAGGACCLPDGTCSIQTKIACIAACGSYNGGANCNVAFCPIVFPGTCCLPDGSCLQTTACLCEQQGGVAQPFGLVCGDPGVCGATGACCRGDGTCQVTTPADCNGPCDNYQGDGSPCGLIIDDLAVEMFAVNEVAIQPQLFCLLQVPTACCLSDGTCIDTTACLCNDQGGNSQGGFTTCANLPPNTCGGEPPVCVDASTKGCWEQLPNTLVTSVNAIALKNGKVMIHDRTFGTNAPQLYQIFDPVTDTFSPSPAAATPFPHNMYCAGFDQLADGRVLIAGGLFDPDKIRATVYDPLLDNPPGQAAAWTAQDDMASSRFYPSVISLANGELLAVEGNGTGNPNIPESFGLTQSPQWRELFAAEYGPAFPPPNDFDLPLYPRLNLISTGSVIFTGSIFGGDQETRIFNPVFETWNAPFLATTGEAPIVGTSGVMYQADEIMKAGPTQVWTLSTTTPDAEWRQLASMAFSRFSFYTIALPDGSILAEGSVTTPELYDPQDNAAGWKTMNPAGEIRGGHHSALLLGDGRVFTAGAGSTAEVYSPPYLFAPDDTLAVRPVISAVSAKIQYGKSFQVTSSGSLSIDTIRLIRLGAATHSWDMGQQSMELDFAPSCCNPNDEPGQGSNPICFEGSTCCTGGTWACNAGDGSPTCSSVCDVLEVTAPQNSAQAPAGFYYLFVVANGVPSEATIMQVGQ